MAAEWQNLSALIRCQFAELRLQLVSEVSQELRDVVDTALKKAGSTEQRWSFADADNSGGQVNSQDCHDWLKRHRRSFLSSKILAMLEDQERTHGMMVNLPSVDRVHPTHEPAPPDGPATALRLAAVEESMNLKNSDSQTPADSISRQARSYHSTQPKRPTRASVMEWAFGLKRQGSARFEGISSCRTRVLRLVTHTVFETASMLMLLANAIAIGVQTDYMAVNQVPSVPQALRTMDMIFCIFFSLELTLRLVAFGKKFFVMTGCAWNILDIILVIAQVTEELLLAIAGGMQSNADVMRAVRIMRVIKVLRLVGMLRMAEDLQLLINCLLLSLKQFVWSALLLMMAIYVMAVYVTQAATTYRLESSEGIYAKDIAKWWGSLPLSVLSLFQGIAGGVDWHQISEPLMNGISPWFGLLFVIFMAFCILALLNVITGTFVETMSQQAKDLHLRGRIVQARRLFKAWQHRVERRNAWRNWNYC
ncbi:unnamed protein product [Durusdinium trenchii]|uniref:Ion transport domain-containing protein n=1 Tax=Durusdinium trenchii TaxID=1381693 RepID=A0ABP0Q9G1_9DINO